MMNLLALGLVLTSLAAAGVFSPTPEAADNHEGSTIIKEGHRVVVVEYDQHGHRNTKIKISPENHDANLESGALDNAKEKIKEAASVLPNLGQGLSQEDGAFLHTPRELICDASGKCKHKIARAMGKAKDKVSETAHDAIEKQKEIAHEIIACKKEAAHKVGHITADAVGKAKGTAHDAIEKQKEIAQEIIDTKKETAREVGHTAADAVGKAKETASHAADSVTESTKESVGKAKDSLQNAVILGCTIWGDIVGNVSNHMALKIIREATMIQTLNSLMGVFNLMGFSIAYGLCVWVTFISSYVLSRAMPRQQFGVVQSKIYPVYFKAMAYSIGLALLGHSLSHSKRLFTSKPEKLQIFNLLGSLLTVFVNSVYLEPRATKVMFERMKIEKEEGRGREDIASEHSSKGGRHQHPDGHTEFTTTATGTAEGGTSPRHEAVRSRIIRLNEKLKKLNSYSSFLNILTLMSLTWHLVYLAQRLQLCPSSD